MAQTHPGTKHSPQCGVADIQSEIFDDGVSADDALPELAEALDDEVWLDQGSTHPRGNLRKIS